MSSRSCRYAALLGATLVGALLPVLGVASPAHADAGCQHEAPSAAHPFGCDDIAPPETTLVGATPAPARGYVASTAIRFDFAGTPGGTGEADPVTFECELYATANDPASYQPCTSPAVFSGLAQSGAVPYTFKVRAVDASDDAIAGCDGALGCLGTAEAVADHDATPVTVAFNVDTTTPNTFLTRAPRDEIRPDWPVALTRRPQLVLNSNEGGAGFRCEVNGRIRPCAGGVVTLARLRSGPQTFSAQAVDAAGNLDPTPAITTFFVPADLEGSAGWTRLRRSDAFDGDLLSATKVGAVLRVGHQRDVRELRLIGPSGPRLGKVQVRVGHSRWYTVDLSGKAVRQRTYLVRDQFAPRQSGAVTVRVLSVPGGGSVQLDALVARG